MNPTAGRAAAIVLILLGACGGDDGGGNSTGPSAEGAYAGPLTGSGGSRFDMLVLENGEYWLIHGTTIGDMLFVAGFTQGNGDSNSGSFTSGNARDYSLAGTLSAAVSATYTAGTSIQGTVTYPGASTVSFSGTKAEAAPYDYASPPTPASIAGEWQVTHLDGSLGIATIGLDGAFTTVSGSCASSGTVRPRASGKNIYDVTQTFGGAPCATPGVSGRGIGIYLPIAGTSRHQLIVGSVSNDRSTGDMFFAER